MSCAVDLNSGCYLAATAIFRRNSTLIDLEVDEAMLNVLKEHEKQFVKWNPDSFMYSFCDVPRSNIETSMSFLGNHTAICDVFKRIKEQWKGLYKTKAFKHYYTGEGLDSEEFEDAGANLSDIVGEYFDCFKQ